MLCGLQWEISQEAVGFKPGSKSGLLAQHGPCVHSEVKQQAWREWHCACLYETNRFLSPVWFWPLSHDDAWDSYWANRQEQISPGSFLTHWDEHFAIFSPFVSSSCKPLFIPTIKSYNRHCCQINWYVWVWKWKQCWLITKQPVVHNRKCSSCISDFQPQGPTFSSARRR